MVGYLFAVLYSKVLARLHRKFGFSDETLARVTRARHHVTVIMEGLEFHLFLTFFFPLTKGLTLFIANHTGMEFLLRLYGGH